MTSIVKNADGSHTIPADFVMETTIGVRAGGKTFQWLASEMPANAIEAFLVYGGQRKFNDKVGGSDTTVETKWENAAAMIENFKKGAVGRVMREAIDPVVSQIRRTIKSNLMKKNPSVWAKIKTLESREIGEKLDAIFAAQSDEIRAALENAAKKEIARRNAEKKREDAIDLGEIGV